MRSFKVTIKKFRSGFSFGENDFYVEAASIKEAEQKALDDAQCEFSFEFDYWEIVSVEDLGEV